MAPVCITTKAELDDILAKHKLVVIDMYAEWCGPCKMIAPTFNKLSEEREDVAFIKVDVDESDEITEFLKVAAMPTFIFFKNSQEIHRFQGANGDKLKKDVNNYFSEK